jgi:hypothetical protein
MNRLVGGVVLVHGSGPSERNETIRLIFPSFMIDAGVLPPRNCDTGYVLSAVFTQIAEHLAYNGFDSYCCFLNWQVRRLALR